MEHIQEAQKSEIKLFDELLKDLVQAIPEPERLSEDLAYRFTKICSAHPESVLRAISRHAYCLFQNATRKGQIGHTPHFNATSESQQTNRHQYYIS